jgi:hypothetical protein
MTINKINGNNTQQLSQFSGESASLEEKRQTQAKRAFERIKPFPCGKAGIGLSFRGIRFFRCRCGAYLVEAKLETYLTVWLCKTCAKPRLIQRRKSDAELISELLGNLNLKGWDKLFCSTLAKAERIAPWQQEKLEGIAKKLGIETERNCSPSELEGGKS